MSVVISTPFTQHLKLLKRLSLRKARILDVNVYNHCIRYKIPSGPVNGRRFLQFWLCLSLIPGTILALNLSKPVSNTVSRAANSSSSGLSSAPSYLSSSAWSAMDRIATSSSLRVSPTTSLSGRSGIEIFHISSV